MKSSFRMRRTVCMKKLICLHISAVDRTGILALTQTNTKKVYISRTSEILECTGNDEPSGTIPRTVWALGTQELSVGRFSDLRDNVALRLLPGHMTTQSCSFRDTDAIHWSRHGGRYQTRVEDNEVPISSNTDLARVVSSTSVPNAECVRSLELLGRVQIRAPYPLKGAVSASWPPIEELVASRPRMYHVPVTLTACACV